MFPRNIRTCKPTTVGLMLRVFSTVLASSKNHSLEGDSERTAQEIENDLIGKFNELGLKEGNILQHKQSGGYRTYLAYFKQLGLCFERETGSANKRSWYFTIAGKELAELNNPALVIRKQVLRYQFPSPYSKSQNVKIDENVTVKPAIFVLKMAQTPQLGYVCDIDIAIACVYGRNDSCFEKVVEKCLKARTKYQELLNRLSLKPQERRIEAIIAVLDEPYKDLYTKKTEKDSKNTDYIEKRITEILYIGNTLIKRLDSVGLLLKDINQKSDFGTNSYKFNEAYSDEFETIMNEPLDLEYKYTNEEAWQRRLGRGSRDKDTRVKIDCDKFNLQAPDEYLKQETLKKYADSGTLFDIDQYVKDFSKKMGKDEEYIRKLVETVLPNFETDISRQLNETGTDPKRHKEYEQNIAQLLRFYFPSATVKHIGTKKRQDKSETQHNYSDVLFRSRGHDFLQIDAKSTANIYEYRANDVSKSEDYAKYPPKELFENEYDQQKAFLIVTAAYSSGAKNRIQTSEYRTGIPFRIYNTNEFVSLIQNTTDNDRLFVTEIAK